MKRFEVLFPPGEYRALAEAAKTSGMSASAFVRVAVSEKQHRTAARAEVASAGVDLGELVRELRQEVGRLRRDLMDDNARGLELIRQEVVRSLKKNEELQKAFVLALAGQTAPPSKPSRPAPPDDGPMRIPG